MRLMYPGFLFGLLAVAIPVVIHLLQLRRPQKLLFTNTAFIREVELVTVRHRNIQRWLLLLTRVLGVIGLVLLFCQPYIPAHNSGESLTGATVLVDNSYSMQRRGESQTSAFSDAVEEARNIGKGSTAEKQIELVNDGGALLSATAYQTALDELKMAAENALSLLGKVGAGHPNGRRALYVLSDFQKKSIKKEALTGLGNQEVVLIPIPGKNTANLYIDSVWLDDAFVRARTSVGLHIRVRNGGGAKAENLPVKVFVEKQQVAAYRVSAEPGQAVTSMVQLRLESERVALGRVVTEDAPVTFDNTYYFTLQPAAAIRILEIGAKPAAQQLYSNEPLFTYSFANPQAVDYGVLQRASLVLVHELERVDAGLRGELRSVVQRGGSVVVIPSSAASSHESYQQLFKSLGLGTVQWEELATTPEFREVAMPSSREPFFRDVFGAQQRTATMPRAAPVLRWSRTGTDILRLRDGESYLAEFASGTGRVYVFSAPFAQQYTDFTAHALFVPVMYRLAMLSYRNDQLPAYRLTQDALTLTLPSAQTASSGVGQADEASFKLVQDSIALIPAQRVVANELRLSLPDGMDAPGFYQVQRAGKVLTTLAFNPDKRESDLAAYSAEELRQLIGPNHPNITVVESGVEGAGLAKLQAEQNGQPLWRYFVVMVLLALLAESLLVRFGGRKAAAAKAMGAAQA